MAGAMAEVLAGVVTAGAAEAEAGVADGSMDDALGAGILSFCPARMDVLLRSFMAMILLTLVPWDLAIRSSMSPDFTT